MAAKKIAELTASDLEALSPQMIHTVEKVVLLGLQDDLSAFGAHFTRPALNNVTADEIRAMDEVTKHDLRERCRSYRV